MKTVGNQYGTRMALSIAVTLTCWQANAQEQGNPIMPPPAPPVVEEEAFEEVVVLGRAMSATQDLINERLTDANVIDTLGEETISRLGDSTVGAVLRRLPGLTLVNDQFIYIRGLGERYSASLLNGSQIPSPDLTRNVIPLDIFPTSIVQSLRVQKAWSPNLPANFGGGNVDIRTRGIPDGFVFNLELGSGYNDLNDNDGLTYAGGDDDKFGTDDGTRRLSPVLLDGISRFQGQLGVQDILVTLQREDPTATVQDAELINRQLGTEINRGYDARDKSMPLDLNGKLSVGNNWFLNNEWEVGALLGASYQTQWRQQTAFSRNFNFPDERTDTERETTRSVNISGTLAMGVKYLEDHEIATSSLWLRNTDDETAISDFFNENREKSDGLGFRNYRFEFEERELATNQIRGTHRIGIDTREKFGLIETLLGWTSEETEFTWYYSDSESQTSIPNRAQISAATVTDPVTGSVLAEETSLNSQAANYRFTDLDDEVQDYGWAVDLPFETDRNYVVLSGGWSHAQKVRTYRQLEFSLGALEVDDPDSLVGPLNEVFSDDNILDPNNNFVFDQQGTNQESYLAATMTDAVFGNVDWTFDDTWRVSAGLRWEDYKQAAIEWNPLGFTALAPQVNPCNLVDPCDFITNDDDSRDFSSDVGFAEDDIFPAASLTYMGELWGADTFQLRFGWSETAVRPDLREITAASYIDPITDDLTRGNPGVTPADVSNFDVRGEWFFGNGDNFTVTYFYKDLTNPIEFFESAVSDTKTAREIVNAESAEVQGVEVEFLKELGFLGGIMDSFFLQANATFQETELVAGPNADAPTNAVRALAGASDWMANVVVGFDAPNAKHTASVIFNTFGERLYVAGRNGAPDSFEQPFNSLDFTYSYYPTDTITLKFKAVNLLGDEIEIRRQGVPVFIEDPGSTISFSFQYAML